MEQNILRQKVYLVLIPAQAVGCLFSISWGPIEVLLDWLVFKEFMQRDLRGKYLCTQNSGVPEMQGSRGSLRHPELAEYGRTASSEN